jgi:hypothetical protein
MEAAGAFTPGSGRGPVIRRQLVRDQHARSAPARARRARPPSLGRRPQRSSPRGNSRLRLPPRARTMDRVRSTQAHCRSARHRDHARLHLHRHTGAASANGPTAEFRERAMGSGESPLVRGQALVGPTSLVLNHRDYAHEAGYSSRANTL